MEKITIKEIMSNMSDKDWKELFEEIEKKQEEIQEKVNYTKTKEYNEWIYDNINRRVMNDIYDYNDTVDEITKKNTELLYYYIDYIKELSKEQNREKCTLEKFEKEKYNIKIKDRYFRIVLYVGLGSYVFIEPIEEEANYVEVM